jgi:hypothetical protein
VNVPTFVVVNESEYNILALVAKAKAKAKANNKKKKLAYSLQIKSQAANNNMGRQSTRDR